ncbi:rhamnosyltransferase [Lactobacillus brevis] [Lactiplantibacillus mudanjiangensis]|uniref:glycosyltransferase family 2 protein n=1 Tax=Lactiplantibacillus mudanjiangensis TaxID=1296538 RepID=UPI0010155F5B|nr:glycosyltransferase family 2 protein [Lactiplantibacillus mudanjiangensis]VDG32749.1 rhamnosyltransferase [Lactobacillus brevis] [Lactiplantibacillus mudanjiangensis]
MKIGSVIVTFNPNIEQLRQVLDAISTQVIQIEVIDNHSDNFEPISMLINLYDNVNLLRLDANRGIAKAQNVGFEVLGQDNCEWVLTLDQDTIVPNNYIHQLKEIMPIDDAGIITGAYVDLKWNTKKIKEIRKVRRPNIQAVDEEISSGNLVLMDAWRKLNGFDEELFIDYVDFDFDYRLVKNGYKLYRVNSAEFQHEIGSQIKDSWLTKVLFLSKHELFDHSSMRLYYINRNRLIVRRRYPEFGSPFRMFLRELLNLREIFVMSFPKMKKMKCAIVGIVHGLFYR